MDTGQRTESLIQVVDDIDKGSVVLPEFQRDFVWDVEKTYDLFDSFIKDIFVGALIYGVPSFEITARVIDGRPRTGKGSRQKLKLQTFSKQDIEKLVKTHSFRLLLDGQQRVTSLYRALKGLDSVTFVLKNDDELTEDVRQLPSNKRSLDQTILEIRANSVEGRICIALHDVYKIAKGEMNRDAEKAAAFLSTSLVGISSIDEATKSPHFDNYLSQAKLIENLLRQEKLIAYYLLDTDEEKFALFFERSNSKGIQLSFIDILAAKLYAGFNLRAEIERFIDENPSLRLNREVLVRTLSYIVSGGKDTGRGFILSSLSHAHFNEHWQGVTKLYQRAYEYLSTNRLLIHPDWMPYENMLIPLMLFFRKLPHYDFSQMSDKQARILRLWYLLAVMSRRYSSAAQTYVIEDGQALEKLADNDFGPIVGVIERLQPAVRAPEDLLTVYKKFDALYKGLLNLLNFHTGGFVSWQNNEPLSFAASSLEDHHIFPKDYLHKMLGSKDVDMEVMVDCVANRTLIPKLTNIKASNKPPSIYLQQIIKANANLPIALKAHAIPIDVANGAYDDLYEIFLDDRAKLMIEAVDEHVLQQRTKLLAELKGN